MRFNEFTSHTVTEGYLDNPGAQDSPVASAITRRILLQRTDLLGKYGPEKVGAAVDEVADFVGDVDEIGSSDVSGWIRHVEQMLGNMGEGVAEGIMNTIANKVMGAAPEQPKYKVGQRVKYETSPHQPEWKDGGRGVGVITAYKNGHYMINGNPVNHFEIKGVVEQGVAEGFSDVVKGIKRKVAGKSDPKEVEHMYGRIARSAIKHKTPDQAEKDIERYKKVSKVVNKEGVAEGGFKNKTAVFSGYSNYMRSRAPNVFKQLDIKVLNKEYFEDEDIIEYTVISDGDSLAKARATLETNPQFGGMVLKKGVTEGSKEKTPGIALSKAYKKDFDDKKPGQDRKETALTGAYSKTGKPGGELKKQGVAEDSIDQRIAQAKKNNPLRASVAKKTNGYAALVMDTSTGKPSWFGGALWQTPELAMGHAKAFVKGFPYLEQEYAQRFIDKNRNGIVEQGVAEAGGRDSWDSNMPGYQGDYGGAENWGRRSREDDEHHEIDRQREQQLAQYNQTGKFWLKYKDSQKHVSAEHFIGKAAATAAAQQMIRAKPEVKGNLLITAHGPNGE